MTCKQATDLYCIKLTLATSRMSWVSDGSSPWSGESGTVGIMPLVYGIMRAKKFVKYRLKHTSLEIVSLETVNKVWQTCEANRCLTRVSYLPEMKISNQFTSSKFQITHEPVKLSTKTRRTKSSIEYVILSMTTEQSGSVASCFSLPCISPNAAMKNKRFSIINNPVKKKLYIV